jgi:hypothetical protein
MNGRASFRGTSLHLGIEGRIREDRSERIHIPGVVMMVILCVYGNWNSRRHGSRSGAFQEPSPIHRRLVICRRHSP